MRTSQPWRTDRSRALRHAATAAEKALWGKLRNRQLAGWKFVRQHPIGIYFADLACRDAMLVVEIDGETHSTELEIVRDAERDGVMHAAGYRVLRIANRDVYDSIEGVLDTVLAALEA